MRKQPIEPGWIPRDYHREPVAEQAAKKLHQQQMTALALGSHPLGRPLSGQARLDAEPFDPPSDPSPRCGNCTHFQQSRWPKCDQGPIDMTPDTDVAAWWPACLLHEPRSR